MKTFLVLVLSVTALFLWQRNSDRPGATASPAPNNPTSAKVSEHNWPKNSIDRAREVAQQVRTSRENNQQP